MRTSKALTLALALLWPVAGGAQDRAFDRGFVDVNAVSQASSSPRVRHMLRYPPSDPTQRYQVGYEVPDGPAFDISGGMRISPNLSVGLAVSRFGRSSRTDVDSVDVFARRGTVVHLGHRQRGYHLQTSWVVRVADRLDVAFFAGPSLFSVLQTRVTDVAVREVEPWSGSDYIPEPRVTGVSTRGVKHRLAGYNYGFDFTFRLAERVGIGILVRTAMSIRPSVSGRHTEVPVAGGSHVGIGARFRF